MHPKARRFRKNLSAGFFFARGIAVDWPEPHTTSDWNRIALKVLHGGREATGTGNQEPGTERQTGLTGPVPASYVGVRTGNTSAGSRCMWLSRSRNPLGVARYCSIRLRFESASSCDSEEWKFKGKILHS